MALLTNKIQLRLEAYEGLSWHLATLHEGDVITRLKKTNAALSLLTSIALLIHVGYSAFAYLTFYYNPGLKTLTSLPFILCACAHGVLGMCAVFLQGDGTRLDTYLRLNWRTVAQRVSAALIFPLLIVHLKTFNLLQTYAGDGSWALFVLVMLVQVVFYAAVATHVATSFSRALITLGILGSRETQRKLDRVVYALCVVAFLGAALAVIRGELAMFLPR